MQFSLHPNGHPGHWSVTTTIVQYVGAESAELTKPFGIETSEEDQPHIAKMKILEHVILDQENLGSFMVRLKIEMKMKLKCLKKIEKKMELK